MFQPSRLIFPITQLFLASLILFAELTAPAAARAQGNLRAELSEVAKSIKQLLAGRSEDAVAVGQFTGPAHLPSSAGPAITKVLAEELVKQGIAVKVRANLTIEGRYRDATDKKSGLLTAHLKVRVVDRRDETIVEFERAIFGDATLPALFGLSVELPPEANAKARSKKLEEALDKPKANITRSRVSAGPGSPYAVEILVKKKGDKGPAQPRGAEEKEGLAFVPIQRGEVYEVRLINDSPYEAAVTLTIDGLNMFVFSDLKDSKTGQPRYEVVLVPAKKAVTIKGWHRTNENSNEFVVTEYAKSAVAELKSTANIGTITACFAAAWPKDGAPPADEPKSPSKFSRSADATGRGSKVEAKYQEVERYFGVVRASVSVRYTR